MSGLESATYINQLNPLNPDGTLDYVSTGDDHLRLIKSTLQSTFTRIVGPVTASDGDLTNTTYLVDSGTLNTVVLTFSPVWTAYTAGKGVLFKVANTNTSAVTVNINSLGAITLLGASGQALVGGEIIVGGIYHIVYDGTNFRLDSNDGYSKVPNQVIAATTNASIKNTGTGSLTIGTNAQNNIVLNADGSTSVAGVLGTGALTVTGALVVSSTLSVGGVANQGFASGTRMPFAMTAAPTGWTQDVTDSANNRMLRVVSSAGNGIAGSHSPILMNVVPAHTHAFSTGGISAGHIHYDSGHNHTAQGAYQPGGVYGSGSAWAATFPTTVTTSWGYANLGAQSADHSHSGSTDNGSSQVNWTPRYIDLIICSKN